MRFCLANRTAMTWLLTLTILGGLYGTVDSAGLDPRFVRPRVDNGLSAATESALQAMARDGRVKIWVFFTDKGFYDQRGMQATMAASGVALQPRAAARRAKVGRGEVEFIDMPLRSVYVDRIIEQGATLRHRSRWLNAASFEVPLDLVRAIAAFPFVARIQPVIGFRRAPEPDAAIESDQVPEEPLSGPQTLNYGPSLGQLTQINVPAAHTLGYAGQGVLVCMMDTGFRKDHSAFSQIITEGRLLADSDFVFLDGETQDEDGIDLPGAHNHGTYTWSALGGAADGALYGPAYLADFLLAKTEDVRSETRVEEDNWTAAAEWAEGLGADVISSSLGYSDWYTFDSLNGDIATVTIAADLAAALGVVVCASIGNSGPAPATLKAPADADTIISVGAVLANGSLAAFSSRGPTFDGRIKPEVCAQGSGTWCANPGDVNGFTTKNGTSMSCPLVGGAAAIILSAHPDWTPVEVRTALMVTASNSATPDNNFGWGIIDVVAAINNNCAAAPDDPAAPVALNPTPCSGSNYQISWAPVAGATDYTLYEGEFPVYSGSATKAFLNHLSGSYDYRVVAANDCGSSGLGPLGGTVVIRGAPAIPDPPVVSETAPCFDAQYTVSWNPVADADAYELYENGILVYAGSDTSGTRQNDSGSFVYKVLALNICGKGDSSLASTAAVIRDCHCHGDPVCDGAYNVLDVVTVVSEAFRGTAATVDPTCPHSSRADVNCDCAVTVLDVVHFVNVAFKGADAATEFCNACNATCP